MTARFDKSRLPSRHVTEGPQRAPQRSYFYAMGLSDKEIHQPWVGVATCWNEAAPCNISLNRQAQAVKAGVKLAGGTPREFTTITVTDGIAMGHEGMRSSLASRDAIADSVELTMRGHCYDPKRTPATAPACPAEGNRAIRILCAQRRRSGEGAGWRRCNRGGGARRSSFENTAVFRYG